jgi:hypothetical protein
MSIPKFKKDINVKQVKSDLEKYILTLIIDDKSRDNNKFIEVLNQLQNKIKNDIANYHYKSWLNDNLQYHNMELNIRLLMIEQKIVKDLYKVVDNGNEKYSTMNCKMLKQENGGWMFDTNCIDMETENIIKENGSYKLFEPSDYLLYTQDGIKKKMPKLYCIFSISIWIINGNIYLSPNIHRILLKPIKRENPKVVFNLNKIK